jgi:hypothetical protein
MNLHQGDTVVSRNGQGHAQGNKWYIMEINKLSCTASLYPLQDTPGFHWSVEIIERPLASLRKVD